MATATTGTTMPTASTTETTRRCDLSKVKEGSVFSRHSFGKVIAIHRGLNRIELRNSEGLQWHVDGTILEQEFSFADQSDGTEEVSRTDAIKVITENPRTAMTINYNKKADPKVVAKELAAGQGNLSAKEWNAKVSSLMDGEERTMIGWHYNSFDAHGRLNFIEEAQGPRLVDPRTVNWVVVNRKRYNVKG